MNVRIDKEAGFCSGVRRAIRFAEEGLKNGHVLYCLGQIVHNEAEVARLQSMGMKTIHHHQLQHLRNAKVLIRAHGEPPQTYNTAHENNLTLIDGTCPTVLRLQSKINSCYRQQKNAQIVIFGHRNHPEVIGLNGQTNNSAIIIENADEVEQLDFSRPVCLFAQTTQNKSEYQRLINLIKSRKVQLLDGGELHFTASESICVQVSNREQSLRQFARDNDVVLFAGGDHSSNGKYLFGICHNENPNTYYISGADDIRPNWLENKLSAGVTGATSTPQWLLDEIAMKTTELTQSQLK